MDAQKVDMFIMANGDKLPQEKVMIVREKLLALDDSKWAVISALQYKNATTALILSILIGTLGIDRFYIGQYGLGAAKLITCGGLGIWYLVDWLLISKSTRERNYQKLCQYLN